VFRQARRTWLQDRPDSRLVVPKADRALIRRIDKWLDRGRGECLLGRPEANRLVASALLHFDGSRYALDEFAVMPNHSHSLVLPFPGIRLETIVHSWKSYLSLELNRLLGRSGTFWMEECFDRIVRDWADLEYYRMYIRENPLRAGLAPGQYFLGRGGGIE
jgi:REP element-mobilizing transposase RayT